MPSLSVKLDNTLAMVSAGGRVVIPILIQQAIDHGFGPSDVRVNFIIKLAIVGLAVIVVATIALGGYIATEATLSFLGIGLQDPTISWGIDINSAQKVIRTAPFALFFPAGMLSLTVLAFIMLGDAVRDALDPKLR